MLVTSIARLLPNYVAVAVFLVYLGVPILRSKPDVWKIWFLMRLSSGKHEAHIVSPRHLWDLLLLQLTWPISPKWSPMTCWTYKDGNYPTLVAQYLRLKGCSVLVAVILLALLELCTRTADNKTQLRNCYCNKKSGNIFLSKSYLDMVRWVRWCECSSRAHMAK